MEVVEWYDSSVVGFMPINLSILLRMSHGEIAVRICGNEFSWRNHISNKIKQKNMNPI
jgi:hypothetical protein